MSETAKPHAADHGPLAPLALAALGVVFGDIGTSPLYTLQVGVASASGAAPQVADVIGVLSLIVWALTLVVTIKYIGFVMRADNRGEGGILALLALVPQKARAPGSLGKLAIVVVAGAALLYGDGMITPAISVLSAMEGLVVVAPAMQVAVVPLTCVVLIALFAAQRLGTGGLGRLFGPVMVVWFVTIGALGLAQIVHAPWVLHALSPHHAAHYFVRHGLRGVPILGIVVLAITGGEALYADMGHFGARPIRLAWLAIVFPTLLLCYLGQGALILSHPGDAAILANPFFAMAPGKGATLALVLLATAATVIASQALISGVFSLTQQGVQLGLFPRVQLVHTSKEVEGQIYAPAINAAVAVACIALVVIFRESSKLANAFGLAVSGTMAITSIAFFEVTRTRWKWPLWKSVPTLVLFLSFDIPFCAANMLKLFEGGYIPLLVGSVVFVMMIVWSRGRSLLADELAVRAVDLDSFLREARTNGWTRTPGTAVVMSIEHARVPSMLHHHAQRTRAYPEQIVLLGVVTEHVPEVDVARGLRVEDLGHGFRTLRVPCGYMQQPDVPEALRLARASGALTCGLDDATYYVGSERLLAGPGGRMSVVPETLFAFMKRNAYPASLHFRLPPERVVEVGMHIDL
ncbi:MAG: potassium transporter Kup [Polyangiales bacterium]